MTTAKIESREKVACLERIITVEEDIDWTNQTLVSQFDGASFANLETNEEAQISCKCPAQVLSEDADDDDKEGEAETDTIAWDVH